MRKVLITVAIIGIVAGAHFVIIKTFMKDKKKDAKGVGTEKTVVPPPGSEPGKELGLPPGQSAEKPKTAPAPGRAFTYKYAVMGNIKDLPDSKNATSGLLVDLDTRAALWAKEPRKGVPIASMTKMMTALLAFEDITAGRNGLSMDTAVQVTPGAVKIGGSQVYLDTKEKMTMADLLKTVMIVSANDSAELIAEHLGGGDVVKFVDRMNARASELRLPATKFYNPTGLPGKSSKEDNVSSPEGMVFLAEQLLQYPKAVEWASTWIDYIRKDTEKPFMLKNHNHLIKMSQGCNGMKTGFIDRSGFCVTFTVERGGRHIAGVVTGFKSRKERDLFAAKLIDWGYRRNPVPPPDASASSNQTVGGAVPK